MRIAFVTPGFSADEEDWCVPALLNLARELAKRHDVHIFALRYPHRRARYEVFGATVHAEGAGQLRGLRRGLLYGRALRSIVTEARRESFDVLHAWWAHEPGFVVNLASRLLATPAVVSILGGELEALPEIDYGGQLHLANRTLIRMALHRAEAVTVGSSTLLRRAREHVPGERLALLPLGVDAELFAPVSTPPVERRLAGAFRLLQVGALAPVKDQGVLLRAFARTEPKARGAHLHIVGDGELRAGLEAEAAALGLEGEVTFHGAVEHHDLVAYYQSCDLCVLTSRFESQGMVVLEAAGCERPTLGTEVGVLPELMPSSWRVAVGDVDALAAALTRSLGDPERCRQLGAQLRRTVLDRFRVEATGERLVSLYEGLGVGRRG